MYQIGLFSKMNQITIKTLHHYDDIGLLKPARIDQSTGYRYYSSSQFYDLYRIRFLKQLDFSLEDIQKMLDGESKEAFLLQKKEELLRDIADKAKMLGQIDYYLTQSQQESQGYEVLIKTIPACIVLSRRLTIDKYADLFKEMIQMESVLSELKCKKATPNYCFNRYHNQEYKESDVDVEICEAVTKAQQNIDNYNFLSLDQIDTAACVIHKGSYNELPNAYYALTTWIEKNHYEINGLPRESYIEGKWNGIDESEWLTEIQFPVRKITV